MSYIKLSVFLVSVFCFDFGIVSGQQCNDCQLVRDCPEALRRAAKNDPTSQQLLRGAFCGFQKDDPKVCCSAVGDESLDSHPNLSLLPQDCGFINGDKLIGGINAGLYSFPWMTLISHKTRDGLKFDCGGTLINKRYVLTAAHCIKGLDIAGVRIGEYDLRVDTDCEGEGDKYVCESKIQDVRVEQSVIHPGYHGKPGVLNDIGLLRLKKEVNTAHKNAKPVCLPVTSSLRKRQIFGEKATLAGWGITENHESAPILQTVDVPIHSAEDCRSQYNRGNNPSTTDATLNKICAGTVGKDSCNGDSGGPLMLPGTHSGKLRHIQYGIVSYGPRLCGSQFPGVYTDVSKYMKWILDTIRP